LQSAELRVLYVLVLFINWYQVFGELTESQCVYQNLVLCTQKRNIYIVALKPSHYVMGSCQWSIANV
jgi:hypothetical protein